MAGLQALILSLLVAYGYAQTTTTESPTSSSATTAAATTSATTTSATTTSAPMPTAPAQPPFEQHTFKLMSPVGNGSCAELTMALQFDITYENENNASVIANVVVPGNANVTGTCADKDSDILAAEIILEWGHPATPFKLNFAFTGFKAPTTEPPTTVVPTNSSTTNSSATTKPPTTSTPTTNPPTTNTPAPARRRLLAHVSAENEGRLDGITLTYNTAAPEFINPKMPTAELNVFFNTSDSFTFEEGTNYKCNSQQNFKSGDVDLNIKDVLLNPFASDDDKKVTTCSADSSGLSNRDKIIIGVCAGVGGLLILILLIVILARCCKRSGYKSV